VSGPALGHGRTKDAIDSCLIAVALGFEPGENAGIHSDGHSLLQRAIEFADLRGVPVGDFGDGSVDIGLPHFG